MFLRHLSLLLFWVCGLALLRAEPSPTVPPDAVSEFAPAKALYKAAQLEAAAAEGESRLAACRAFYGQGDPALAPYLREMANLYLLLNA